MSEKESRVESIGLQPINPREIEKNPDNPRLIFEKKDLDELKESIQESGILVPLLVYKRNKDGKYVILDGQKRWMCALELGLDADQRHRLTDEFGAPKPTLRYFGCITTRLIMLSLFIS